MLLPMDNFHLIVFLYFLWSIDYSVPDILYLFDSHKIKLICYCLLSLIILSIMFSWALFLFFLKYRYHSEFLLFLRDLGYTHYTFKTTYGLLHILIIMCMHLKLFLFQCRILSWAKRVLNNIATHLLG